MQKPQKHPKLIYYLPSTECVYTSLEDLEEVVNESDEQIMIYQITEWANVCLETKVLITDKSPLFH